MVSYVDWAQSELRGIMVWRMALLRGIFGITMVLMLCGAAGCGGASTTGDGAGADIVAKVGAYGITLAAVNHRMQVAAGQSFYALSHGHVLPIGLVTDPMSDRACEVRLAALAERVQHKRFSVTRGLLAKECRDLGDQLREDAMSGLVRERWLASLAREFGVQPTREEVLKTQSTIAASEFRDPARLRKYLSDRRMSLADLLVEERQDVIAARLLSIVGRNQSRYRQLLSAAARWTQRTTCEPGYVVEHCRQFTISASTASHVSGVVVMEQVSALVTGQCFNLGACEKA